MLGSVAPMLTDALSLSVSAIGLLGALPMPMFAFGALVAPMLAKRFGLEVMMIISGAVLAVGVLSRVWLGVSGLFVSTVVLSLAIGLLNALTAPFIKKYAPITSPLPQVCLAYPCRYLQGYVPMWSYRS